MKITLAGFVLVVLAAALSVLGFQQPSIVVYNGEATIQTADSITLNVTPCDKEPKLSTISPYKKVGEEEFTCQSGRKFTRIAVQEMPAPGASGTKDDKSKKQPPKTGGDAKGKVPDSKDKSTDDAKDKK